MEGGGREEGICEQAILTASIVSIALIISTLR